MRAIKSERYVIVELEKDADQFNSTKEYYDVNGSKVSKPKSGDYKYVYACDKGWLFGGTIYSIKEDAIDAAIHSSRQIKSSLGPRNEKKAKELIDEYNSLSVGDSLYTSTHLGRYLDSYFREHGLSYGDDFMCPPYREGEIVKLTDKKVALSRQIKSGYAPYYNDSTISEKGKQAYEWLCDFVGKDLELGSHPWYGPCVYLSVNKMNITQDMLEEINNKMYEMDGYNSITADSGSWGYGDVYIVTFDQNRNIQSSRRIQSMRTPKNVYLNEDTQKLIQRLEKRVGHELKLKFEEGNTPYVEIEKLPKGEYSFITEKYLNNLAEHFLYDGYKEKQDSFIVYLDPAIMYTRPGIKSAYTREDQTELTISVGEFGQDGEVTVRKLEDGKWHGSDGKSFMGYLKPDDILHWYRQDYGSAWLDSSRQIQSKLDTVKVTFDNGDTMVTDYNADVGREEIAKYYMHNYFNVGGEDEMHQVVKVEFPGNINSARTAEVADMQDANDLALFAENDHELYDMIIKPTFNLLQRKLKRGIYDKDKALIAWEHVIDEAAKAYDRQLGSKRGTMTMFNKATRKEAAKILMDSIWDEDEWQA